MNQLMISLLIYDDIPIDFAIALKIQFSCSGRSLDVGVTSALADAVNATVSILQCACMASCVRIN